MTKKVTIQFPFKPLSQNNIERSASVRMRYKTKEAKDYEKKIKQIVLSHKHEYDQIVQGLNCKTNALKVTFTWCLDNFMTKKGVLSKSALDWDNPIKFTQDCIMRTIGLDDSFIVEGKVKKKWGFISCFDFTLELIELE